MTTCGYGDFHPRTTNERMASIVAMLISSGVFGYYIGEIGKIVSNYNRLAAKFRWKMNYVEKFLREKKIPTDLR